MPFHRSWIPGSVAMFGSAVTNCEPLYVHLVVPCVDLETGPFLIKIQTSMSLEKSERMAI